MKQPHLYCSKVPPIRNSGLIFKKKNALLLETQQDDFCKVSYIRKI